MPQLDPRMGEIYKHFKGNMYQVTSLAVNSETGERMVVYQALYGDFQTYVRPYDEFVSEVDFEKYPACTSRFRFTCIPREQLTGVPAGEPAPRPVTASVSTPRPMGEPAPRPVTASVSTPRPVGEPAPRPASDAGHLPDPRPAVGGIPQAKEVGIHDLMLAFLDERDFEKKEKILSEIGSHRDLSDGIIDNLAAALDYVIDEGPIDVRFAQLRTCVRTRARFENTRLRG